MIILPSSTEVGKQLNKATDQFYTDTRLEANKDLAPIPMLGFVNIGILGGVVESDYHSIWLVSCVSREKTLFVFGLVCILFK